MVASLLEISDQRRSLRAAMDSEQERYGRGVVRRQSRVMLRGRGGRWWAGRTGGTVMSVRGFVGRMVVGVVLVGLVRWLGWDEPWCVELFV